MDVNWIKKLSARKINDKFVNDRVKKFAHLTLARLCDKYVPYRNSPLSRNIEITPEYVRYIVPYAGHIYFGDNLHFNTDHHALATAHWDKVAMQTQQKSFNEAVKNYMKANK